MARIVVIEDDPGTRTIVSTILAKVGHGVHQAADGQQGLAVIEQISPDLVVTDVQMPHIDGMEVLRKLRADERFAALPVIMLTSMDDGPAMMNSMAEGADDYITKPCKASALIEAVHAQLARTGALSAQAPNLATSTGASVRGLPSASLLVAEIRNIAELRTQLTLADIQTLKDNLRAELADAANLHHCMSITLVAEHVVAVFADVGPGTPKPNHTERAALTLLSWMAASTRMCERLLTINGTILTAAPQLGFMLHSGAVQLMDHTATAPGRPPSPLGDALTQILRLRNGIPAVSWSTIITQQALAHIASMLRIGAHERVAIGDAYLDVFAVLGRQKA